MSSSDMLPPESPPAALPRVTGAVTGPSWQDQDGVLRDMWLQNQTPQQIAEALNRSIPAIMTRAARLGLPRRSAPGRKPGRRQLDGNGALMQTGVVRATAPRTPTQEARTTPQTSLRVCLMCLNKFESVGRHNRICASCKGSAEYDSASSLPELHVPAT